MAKQYFAAGHFNQRYWRSGHFRGVSTGDVGPGRWTAGGNVHPGFQEGQEYQPGFQAGDVYHAGFHAGEAGVT